MNKALFITQDMLQDLTVLELFVQAELCNSIGEALRHNKAGSLYVNDIKTDKVVNRTTRFSSSQFQDNYLKLRSGKRNEIEVFIVEVV